jgi:hypothetical protein
VVEILTAIAIGRHHGSAIAVPVVLAGGDHAMGNLNDRLAESLRQHGSANVTVEVIKNRRTLGRRRTIRHRSGAIERHATQYTRSEQHRTSTSRSPGALRPICTHIVSRKLDGLLDSEGVQNGLTRPGADAPVILCDHVAAARGAGHCV